MAPVLAEKPSNWRDLRVRAVSAAVLIPVALAALWGGGLAWHALTLVGVACLAWEWVTMARARPSLTGAMLAIGYFVIGGLALIHLRDAAGGFGNVLYVLLLVWGTDIGAYIAGRAIGGPKLAPAISPGKTWSGAVGGLAASLAIAVVFGASSAGLALAAGLSVISQIGDLAESAAKRHFGVKDSSHLIPGHGGVFDRVDGLLAAAPLAALFELAHAGQALWR